MAREMPATRWNVLVTGATGYVGGRLVPRLLEAGHRVRVLVRDPARLHGRSWLPHVEVCCGDAHQPGTLLVSMRGMDAAYYLIHSMRSSSQFLDRERKAARNFADASRRSGLHRIIYLGGLGEDRDNLSAHLRSRHEVGQILR